MTTEFQEIYKKNPELQKYFGNQASFCSWYGRNFRLSKPTMKEIIEKAKKRRFGGKI